MATSIIIFIATILVLVVIHELGHFLVAKKFGIKVLEFGFGIPPKIWGKKIGETIYSINLLPIGGFVRLFGEDEVDKKILENHRSFAAQNVYKRMAVVVAGVVMNFILAFALLYIVLGVQGFKTQVPYTGKYQFIGVTQQVENLVFISRVNPGSPADSAGLKEGERVIEINGNQISKSQDLINKTKELAGQEVELKVTDGKTERLVKLTPRVNPPQGEGAIGIALSGIELANISYETPTQKLFAGPIHAWNVVAYSGVMMGDLISESIKTKNVGPVSSTVAGPVGITTLANDILTSQANPLIPYLSFMALISLNLAVFNLLPIPALDGGRLFFLSVEAITRKKVHPGFERIAHSVGFAILLMLTLLITTSDIMKIFRV